jgi:transcriptional regulator with XRE-family HTH domain
LSGTQNNFIISKYITSPRELILAIVKAAKNTAQPTDRAVVQESIRPYAIADKLRTLRLRRSMGLKQLAEHTGFSPAMLSRLENGRLTPTLPTLVRIALVFDVGLDYFFTDPRKRHSVAITRRSERNVFPSDPKLTPVSWHFETLDFRANERRINCYLGHFHNLPEDKVQSHSHPGIEFLYLIQGHLEITIGVERYTLGPGDAIYFDSIQKHSYRSLRKSQCTAVIVTTRALL